MRAGTILKDPWLSLSSSECVFMQKLTFVPREPRENRLVCECNAVLLHIAHSANVLRQPAFNQSHLSFKLTIQTEAV